ncbi:hypothetical protein NY78_2038 [Desulfovibrio sp. TomC]|nr:hypothetical protein NY78_2038 [Desulfovibrio sp. TomC]
MFHTADVLRDLLPPYPQRRPRTRGTALGGRVGFCGGICYPWLHAD